MELSFFNVSIAWSISIFLQAARQSALRCLNEKTTFFVWVLPAFASTEIALPCVSRVLSLF